MKSLLKRKGWLVGVAIVSLVVTACGGGVSTGNADPTSTAVPANTPTDAEAPTTTPDTSGSTPDAGGPTLLTGDGILIFTSLGLADTPGEGSVGTTPGKLAPNFRFASANGEELTLADFRGKPVFLNFWATWCGPCRSEMPELQAMHEEIGDEITLLAIDIDESAGQITDFFEDLGLTFPVVIDEGEDIADDGFSLFGLPSSFVIDADGVIAAAKIGPFADLDDLNKSLEKVGLSTTA